MYEDARCVLCNAQAKRYPLRTGDGYVYECPACGGAFAIGGIAHRRAEQGTLHPDVVGGVRSMIAKGVMPRVEFNSGQSEVAALPGKSQSDCDE
ncbi:hypothetical protein KPB05_38240 [Burkholderia gladioli]|uniref:hypothetical protein n=1 Tax=Burkholderia gladioli TaxID=28095 RepID=UPI00285889FB|nr:hypothetical protein [Burkholderia gladioli]MDR8093301.1 hypothetical protein [Burkholderia gladioli]